MAPEGNVAFVPFFSFLNWYIRLADPIVSPLSTRRTDRFSIKLLRGVRVADARAYSSRFIVKFRAERNLWRDRIWIKRATNKGEKRNRGSPEGEKVKLVYGVSNRAIVTRHAVSLCQHTDGDGFPLCVARSDHLLLDPAWVRLHYHCRHSLITVDAERDPSVCFVPLHFVVMPFRIEYIE